MKKQQDNSWVEYSTLGLQIAIYMVLGVYFGDMLDKKYDSGQTWTLVLLLVGIFMGMFQVFKIALRANKKGKNKK